MGNVAVNLFGDVLLLCIEGKSYQTLSNRSRFFLAIGTPRNIIVSTAHAEVINQYQSL